MGLLYTKFYLDFDENDWKQISNNPIVFQTLKDNVGIDIEDSSHKLYKLNFKKGSNYSALIASSTESKLSFVFALPIL